jgi:hypothetical protein
MKTVTLSDDAYGYIQAILENEIEDAEEINPSDSVEAQVLKEHIQKTRAALKEFIGE